MVYGDKDHRTRRSKRDYQTYGHAAAPSRPSGGSKLQLALLAIGILFVLLVCSWQFLLLTKHSSDEQVVIPVARPAPDRSQVMLQFLAEHEANISHLAAQQHDLSQMLRELSEDVKKQHEELQWLEDHSTAEGNREHSDHLLVQGHHLEMLQGKIKKVEEAIAGAAPLPSASQQSRSDSDSAAAAATATAASASPSASASNSNSNNKQKAEEVPDPIAEKYSAKAVDAAAEAIADASMAANNAELRPLPGAETRQVTGEYPEEWLKRFSRAELDASAREAQKWLEGSRQAVKHTWKGYKEKAWGADELKPISGVKARVWAQCGLQILDALSTIWLMGLTDEFADATKFVESELKFDYNGKVSFFEITIRALGGLLSAHALSGQPIFLKRAKELADKMMPGFDPDTGFPSAQINLRTGQGCKGWSAGTVLAEAGTVQLEFRYLSQQVGDPKYAAASDKAMRSIIHAANGRGLVPWGLSRTGTPRTINNHITFGAMGDSYYEYLLKMYLQTSETETEWLEAWKRAMKEMMQRLILKTQGGLTYIAEEQSGKTKHKMDHLACFVGGMLIYGSRELPTSEVDSRWEATAEGITETCYQMYHRQPSGLAPECIAVMPDGGEGQDMKVWNNAGHYLLRPEAAEAIFYMFYYTGDPKYRRMAGEIFEAIEKHARVTYGYSAIKDVRVATPALRDEMETFFLAETMKYLYLTFLPNPRAVIDLDDFVFTTEAHPVRKVKPKGAAAQSHLRGAR
mmetsp:Transcript_57151/g.121503  ORF Transcript_57151/g.121503 Transcript_57151/m.121503 type:complete len:745 (+) Transcript_57151:272-2506(+)